MDKTQQPRKTLTREGLKEILQINFELYKDEPDFFDYLTTLVIYLMEFEYKSDERGKSSLPEPPFRRMPNFGGAIGRVNKVNTSLKTRDGCCPNCNNPVPKDRKVCPYCLSMIES